MPFKRRFKDKYAGSSPENASVVRTLFDLFSLKCVVVDTAFINMPTFLLHLIITCYELRFLYFFKLNKKGHK